MILYNRTKIIKRAIWWVVFYTLIFVILGYFLFPVVWTILTSIKTESEAFSMPPKWIFKPTFENYVSIFTKQPFLRYIMNSVMIGALSTLLALILGTPAAYALSRMKSGKGEGISFFILSTRIAPPTLIILPFFLLYRQIGLYDRKVGLMIVYLIFNLPFVVWIMKLFFDEIPKELDEAAMVDGCSRMRAFLSIILPLTRSGLAATSILCMISSWNEFFFAVTLTGDRAKTLPVAVTSFIQFTGTRWGELCAAATVIMIPLIVFGFIVQKNLVAGMTFGAVK